MKYSTHSNMQNQLVFLCGARDFHAMDWYKSAKELLPDKEIYILTDLISGEGYQKLITEKDIVFKLIIIDKFLKKRQSLAGHKWRNFLKGILLPLQVILLKKFSKKYPGAIYHAHSMYYLILAWAAGVPYVGTPQGSDILVKPYLSKLYKYFTIKSLKAAKSVTVDSVRMKDEVYQLSGVDAQVIQNGIDIKSINTTIKHHFSKNRKIILSSRGFTSIYRIIEILKSRNNSINLSNSSLTFICPFSDDEYMKEVVLSLKPFDKVLGRMDRMAMYKLLISSKLVISIPTTDSSPRSVYEAIFCGCAVAITYHPYYDILPECIKSRIILVDLNDNDWLDKAIEKSNQIIIEPFVPSEEALDMFDQRRSFMKMQKILFS